MFSSSYLGFLVTRSPFAAGIQPLYLDVSLDEIPTDSPIILSHLQTLLKSAPTNMIYTLNGRLARVPYLELKTVDARDENLPYILASRNIMFVITEDAEEKKLTEIFMHECFKNFPIKNFHFQQQAWEPLEMRFLDEEKYEKFKRNLHEHLSAEKNQSR